jgi:hypothetical protein
MALKNGRIYFKDNFWWLTDTPPHVAIKLKALFPHISKAAVNPFRFPNTPEAANDLVWFTERYPVDIEKNDAKLLTKLKCQYDRLQDDMGRILMPDYRPVAHAFKDGKKERDYQAVARELLLSVKRMICGDDLGLGKTTVALAAFMEPKTLPGLVVVQTHLPKQWYDRIEEYTTLKVHRINGTKPYDLPKADIYIMKYSCLAGWSNFLDTGFFKSVAFDEIQELRCSDSLRYQAAKVVSERAEYVLGLTATLIYNYGIEAWNIFNIVKPGCLGTKEEFAREWCTGYQDKIIADPAAFGSYLRSQFIFLRRTRKDVARELPEVNVIVKEIDVDSTEIDRVEDLAVQLSMKICGGTFHERGQATREFDMLMRQSTGLAKAPGVAAMARLFLENKEPIILVGWHRAVYDVWLEQLAEFNPVMFTGSETTSQKDESLRKFMEGETNLFILSLRSGIGIDGLQKRCQTMIMGELDWASGIHEQLKGRIHRDEQIGPSTIIYPICNEGSDPIMLRILGLKSSQAASIIDPSLGVVEQLSDDMRIKELAIGYLKKHKIVIPTSITEHVTG